MPIRITCACGRSFQAKDEHAGKRAKCPACGNVVLIPGEPWPTYDVFLSYSAEDKPTADAACAKLESQGIRCWIAPRDIMPGTEWGATIIDAINDATLFVLIYSSHSNQSQQVGREVERAAAKGKAIIPFRIEDVLPSKSMEYFLSSPHWLDALTPPLERHLTSLAETVRFLLKRGTSRSRPASAADRHPFVDTADASRPAPEAAPAHRRAFGVMVGLAALGICLIVVTALILQSRPGKVALPLPQPDRVVENAPVENAPVENAPAENAPDEKAKAETAWQSVKGFARGQGVGAMLDPIASDLKTAEQLLSQGSVNEATIVYARIIKACQAVREVEQRREKVVAARSAAEKARIDMGDVNLMVDANAPFSQGEAKMKEAEKAFEAAQFDAALAAWQAAATGFSEARDISEKAVAEARVSYEAELARAGHAPSDAIGSALWSLAIAEAQKAVQERRWGDAVQKYGEARVRVISDTPGNSREK